MNINMPKGLETKLVLGIILIDLLFASLAIFFLVNGRNHYQDNFKLTGQNLVNLLEQSIRDKARLIDDAVVRVERELDRQMISGGIDADRLEQILDSEQKQLPEVDAIRITNDAGETRWGKGLTPSISTSYADREFFKSHQEHAKSDLIITEPIIGKISGKWILAFTRCYHTADGKFAGVISAAVPVDTFYKLLSQVDFGRTGTVVLRYTNMGLIARFPTISGEAGQPGNRKVSNEFAEIIESGVPHATFHTTRTPDSVERTYSFSRVSGYPFTLAVGLVDEEYLAPWRTQAILVGTLLGVFFLVTSTLAWMAVRHLRERSAMEKAQVEDLTRRRILIEQSRDGIVVIDHHGKVWEANRRFAEMLGYTAEEVQQLYIWDWDARWTRDQILIMLDQIDVSGDHFETRHRRKDGTAFDVEISSNGAEYAGHKMVFCVCRDITERKQAEDAVRLSEARFREIFEESPIGIAFLGKQRDIFLTNQRYRDFLGYSEAEIIELGPVGLLHPDDWAASVALSTKLRNNEIPSFHMEQRYIRKDKTVVWSDTWITVLRDQDGRLIHTIGWVQDITERKRVEFENKSLQTKLLQSQKMEAIGTLAGGIAHDFNNILGAVLGYAEIAKDESPEGSEVARNLDKVMEAGHRAASLVKQILTFSRQADSERIPLLPACQVREAIKLIRPILPSTITIKQQIDADTKPILADPTQIHQIVMNLCTNAFHAMEQTGGVLNINLKDCELSKQDLQQQPEVQPGSFVVLSVGDSGPGIAPEIWGKIFDPFFTTKEVGKGTGMGLAIAHGIITSYGGFITCKSQPGKGTLFQVFFPSLEQDVTPINKPVEIVPLGKECILFIDDEEMLADLGKGILERLGYEVTIRTNSLEALTTFQNQPDRFDVVITDQTMPGMTGLDLAKRMLQIRPNLPIILCTGYSTLITEEQAKHCGIKGFIMKPMTKKDIATLLRKVLDD